MSKINADKTKEQKVIKDSATRDIGAETAAMQTWEHRSSCVRWRR